MLLDALNWIFQTSQGNGVLVVVMAGVVATLAHLELSRK